MIAQDSYDLEFMLKRLYYAYEIFQINRQKTEYFAVTGEKQFEISINNIVWMQQVKELKYLKKKREKELSAVLVNCVGIKTSVTLHKNNLVK